MDTINDKFNRQVDVLLTGLVKDAKTDRIYNHCRKVFVKYSAATDKKKVDYPRTTFTEEIRKSAKLRDAIHYKQTGKLEAILLEHAPKDIAGDIKEIFMSLDNPILFKEDVVKKGWKRIQKLVYTCNLQEVVTGKEKEKKEKETKTKPNLAEERVERFNARYQVFLEQVYTIFGVAAEQKQKQKQKPNDVLDEFKTFILPHVPVFATKAQEDSNKAFEEYFGESSAWFKQLPCIPREEITDEKWSKLTKADKDALIKSVGELITCMSGLDILIKSPIVNAVKEKAIEIMKRDEIDPKDFLPTSPNFDRTKMLNMAMELLHTIPEATQNKISSNDITTLITNVLSGGDDYPESFNEVFSPDMLDLDCLDCVTDLPVVGDALGPVMAGMQGSLKGHTGKPAFGSVTKPAWVDRD